MFFASSLRDNDVASINTPSKNDLLSSLIVFGCKCLDVLIFMNIGCFLRVTIGSHEVLFASNWAISNWLDIVILKELNQFSLGIQWVKLDLVDSRLDLGIGEQVSNKLNVEV